MKRALLAAALTLLAADALAATGKSVVGSKHDLSVNGPGPIKATKVANPCLFCHAMHGGGMKMSSRPDPTVTYQPYESGTIKARPDAPTGASRICLSCHDGTIAIGQLRKGRIEVTGGTQDGRIPSSRSSHLGTDLRMSHPVSIDATRSTKTHAPGTSGHVKLDSNKLVQCTSCHDPHAEFGGSPEGKFLVEPTARAQLCTSCHVVAMDGSHATSMNKFATAARQDQDPAYVTVAESGCQACHRSHGAATKGQNLKMTATEVDEDVCLRCHGTSTDPTAKDVGRQEGKSSTHRIRNMGTHDAGESPANPKHELPERSIGAMRHATCVDCHDAHEAKHRPTQGQRISGALDGVWGIDQTGQRVDPAQFEWQICLKCHGDSANRSARPSTLGARRAAQDLNLRQVFGSTSMSAHPVMNRGTGVNVPSLKPPLTVASTILCTDCHASDDGPGAGGTGTAGPHGSAYSPILERYYATADLTLESPVAYALCYKCHDRNVLLSPASAFGGASGHLKHVQTARAPCSACHSAHGVSATRGNPDANAHLVDFDLTIVRPLGGAPPYSASGRSCNLTCHGQRHDPAAGTGRY
jgi:predicted CXXCH cytochrome family protein